MNKEYIEEIARQKLEHRKKRARLSFSEKIRIVVELQKRYAPIKRLKGEKVVIWNINIDKDKCMNYGKIDLNVNKDDEIKTDITDFLDYQRESQKTALYKDRVIYPTLGLSGEAGEVSNKVKKILRDADGHISEEVRNSILDEIGDCIWYASQVVNDLGGDFMEVAQKNLVKLKDRKERDVIKGSGDNR